MQAAAPLAGTATFPSSVSARRPADTFIAGTVTSDTTTADTPTSATPTASIPGADTPAADTPTASVPTASVPVANTPVSDTPAGSTPKPDHHPAHAPAVTIASALVAPDLIDRTAQQTVALARAARDRGHAALGRGDPVDAARWLDRALRLAPRDPNLALSLGSVVLRQDPLRAAALFERVATRYGTREAWQGLAATHLLLGRPSEAAGCLAQALSRAMIAPGTEGLANEIAHRTGGPGWCGIVPASADTAPRLHAKSHGPIRLRLDGEQIPGVTLPTAWRRARTLDVTSDEGPLLGSPIDLAGLRRVTGYVEAVEDGGLRGWAWCPADPDTHPTLLIRPADGGAGFRITAHDESIIVDDLGPLARPRGFSIPAERLARYSGTPQAAPGRPGTSRTDTRFPATEQPRAPVAGIWHVRDADGQDLLGSPLHVGAAQHAAAAMARTMASLYPPPTTRHRPGPGSTRPAARAESRGPPSPTSPYPRNPDQMELPPQPAGNDAPDPGLRYAPIPIGTPPPPPVAATRPRAVDVIIPVHNGAAITLACLDSVLPTLPRGARAIVVDDASTDPALCQALDRLAARRRITLIRHPRNLGFPASANAGIAATDRDIVLLNSDTLVPRDWLQRLREAAYASPGIGTATPFSNEATILSYPDAQGGNPGPDQQETERLGALAWKAQGAAVIDIPVGVGFCLYIRRDCLDAVGMLRADIFAQGYGEENDFCLRARALGWRNVAAPGVFVTHRGAASFGGPGRHLMRRNQSLLNALHPGYDALIEAFARQDSLATARRRLDLARWRAPRPERPRRTETVLLITHADGGGVEQRVIEASRAHLAAGRRPIVLRPARGSDNHPLATLDNHPLATLDNHPLATLDNHPAAPTRFPNLRFRMPGELPALLRVLRAEPVGTIEVHHFLDHHPCILDLPRMLGVPYAVHLHDYAWFCPRVALVGAERRYCGEPSSAGCEACVAKAGRYLADSTPIPELIDRSARFLAAARQVQAPSRDTADRMARHFPGLHPLVVPHEDDTRLLASPNNPRPRIPAHVAPAMAQRARVCVAGAIGLHKGYDVLLACARDAADRDLGLEFVVVGTTTDDATLLATDRVFITGRYEPGEAVALIEAQQARIGLLPSIWPETWCLTLTELWRAGLDVVAFDIGAQAERIARHGRGRLLTLGLPAKEINNVLVAAFCRDRDT